MNKLDKFEISIVIPAYNEEKAIKSVAFGINKIIKKNGINAEIVIVNDGSQDQTLEIIKKIPFVRVVNNQVNLGYGAALKAGIRSCDSEFILIADGDAQHNPEDIVRLYKERKKYSMVVGSRTNITSFIRSPPKIMIGIFASYLSVRKIPDLNSGFRIMRRNLVMEYISILPNKFSFTTTITLAAFDGGYSVHYIPIKMRKRSTGKSTMHPIKDTLNFFLLIIRTTMLFNPLKVFIPITIILFIGAIIFTLYGLVIYGSFPKSASIIFMAGMFTFFFGLLADQMSQMRKQN